MLRPSTTVLVAAAAAGAAVLGVAGGVVLEDRRDLVAPTAQEERPVPLAIGPVVDRPDAPDGPWVFEVPVHNGSSAPVRARLAALDGIVDTVRPERRTVIAPGTWAGVAFTLAVNCDSPASEPIGHLRLALEGEGVRDEARLPLPGEGQVLLDYHRDLCRDGAPSDAGDLQGVWILDRAYGEDLQGFLGLMLWRFGRDGSFRADPEGGLLTDDTALRGTYSVAGDLLTIDVQGGYGCGAAGEVVWRLDVRGDDRMTLGWVRGACPDGQEGDVWVLRRVLLDRGLPGPR